MNDTGPSPMPKDRHLKTSSTRQHQIPRHPVTPDHLPIEDMILKTAAQYFGETLFPHLGIQEKIIGPAPTEQIHLDLRKFDEDFNFMTQNGSWLHLEFESDQISRDDLRRFRSYESVTSYTYGVEVTTYVICSSTVQNVLATLAEGINVYHIRPIRLKNHNADQLLLNLRKKRMSGISSAREDLIPLLLTPLMSGSLPVHKRIIESNKFLTDASALTEDEILKMQAVLYALANKFLNLNELAEVKEALLMTRLGQMLMEDGMQKGMQKGMQSGIQKAQERYSKLILKLSENGQTELIIKAAADPALLEKLYQLYKL